MTLISVSTLVELLSSYGTVGSLTILSWQLYRPCINISRCFHSSVLAVIVDGSSYVSIELFGSVIWSSSSSNKYSLLFLLDYMTWAWRGDGELRVWHAMWPILTVPTKVNLDGSVCIEPSENVMYYHYIGLLEFFFRTSFCRSVAISENPLLIGEYFAWRPLTNTVMSVVSLWIFPQFENSVDNLTSYFVLSSVLFSNVLQAGYCIPDYVGCWITAGENCIASRLKVVSRDLIFCSDMKCDLSLPMRLTGKDKYVCPPTCATIRLQ